MLFLDVLDLPPAALPVGVGAPDGPLPPKLLDMGVGPGVEAGVCAS